MTRSYYFDSYTVTFAAEIVAADSLDGRPAVCLDRSYFYPTSGGQPHDTGALQREDIAAQVVDVVERESDGAVLHVLDAPLDPGPVSATIDWPRRFDHMQHHTGQHILSAAFARGAGAETIGFHLSPQSVTIDLDRPDLAAQIEAAESLANDIVWSDRPVTAREVSAAEAAALPLRKTPPARDGRLRLIDIDGFDLTACGGTHVARTGEVGLIKVVKTERRGAATRVEFLCGGRALADYRARSEVVRGLGAALTTGAADLLPAVTRLQEDVKQLRSELKARGEALLRLEAERLLAGAEPLGDARLVTAVFSDRDVDEARRLGNLLAEAGRTVALLGIAGGRAQLIFCRSADAPGTMGEIIRPALAALGGARGGGGPTFAQGGGPPADEAAVRGALAVAAALVTPVS
jgi:alanyl-tRNA synthetase